MNKIIIAASYLAMGMALLSCGGAHGDEPGHAYMPDMYYSRAYEVYGYNMVGGEYDSLRSRGIAYNALPVPGSIARGDMLPYHLTGDSAGLRAADALVDPLDSLTTSAGLKKEAERLYLVNCAICHGTALDGNGPLWKGGEGPFPAKPQVLNDANAAKWTDGHMYHVITFGKGAMGSYASNLRPEQRWGVIKYIRSKQGGAKTDSTSAAAAPMAATGTAGGSKDSTKAKQP